jgi:hypothetical protein
MLAYHRFGLSFDTLLGYGLASALLTASVIDARTVRSRRDDDCRRRPRRPSGCSST